jgi:drug/metabolite transporter (DMT)-like permease
MSRHSQRALAPFAVALLVMVAWGATPVLSKIALREISPFEVGLLRTVLAGLVAVPVLAAARVPLPPAGRARALLAASAGSGFVAFPLLYTAGQQRTSAGHGALILAALPIVTGAYAALLYRRRPRPRWFAGCAIALGGEAALIALRTGGGGSETSLLGDLLVLVAMLVVATGYVAGARLGLRGYGSIATTLWGVTLASVLVAPLLAGSLTGGLPHAGPGPWAAVVILALVTSILGYVGWYWALARGGIQRIATMQFLQPFSGLALAVLVLHETFTLALGVAALVIVAGVAVVQPR